jgi:hypothetical protein
MVNQETVFANYQAVTSKTFIVSLLVEFVGEEETDCLLSNIEACDRTPEIQQCSNVAAIAVPPPALCGPS